MRGFLAVLALSLVSSSGCDRRQPEAAASPSLRIALVTDLKGYLEPCGCTSDPLGGIDRLAAQIRRLDEGDGPLLFLLVGDTFFDTAELDPVRVDQANRNARALAGILGDLGVDAVLPGPSDRAQPAEALTALKEKASFPWLAMTSDTQTVTVDAGGLRVAILGVRPGAARDSVRSAVNEAAANSDLLIVLVDGSRRDANRVGAIQGVDFVLHGGLDEDDAVPPRQAGRAWLFHASRQGQGLTVVDTYRKKSGEPFVDRSEWSRSVRAAQLDTQIADLVAKIASWEQLADVDAADIAAQRERLARLQEARRALDAPELPPEGNTLSATFIPLRKKSPSDERVQTLMREHDKVVNEANRTAFADLKPPALGPNDIAYVGSAACSGCHQPAYAWWRDHAHGDAYMTLQERNKEFNLDCVGCHVTGYEQPGGSTVTHNLDGALVNVGCESCHGPGAAHAKDPEVGILRDTPESTCVQCHNAQHSDLFDYEGYRKTLVVPGHGLPPAAAGPATP